MKEATAEALRVAWYGPQTADTIAEANGILPRQVRRFWAKAKAAGLLPENDARPAFASRSPGLTSAADPVDDDCDGDELSDKQIETIEERQHAANVASSNASLAALKAAHGGDPLHLTLSCVPAALLIGELPADPRNFDPFLHERHAERIFKALPAFTRARDAIVAAILKKRKAKQ